MKILFLLKKKNGLKMDVDENKMKMKVELEKEKKIKTGKTLKK